MAKKLPKMDLTLLKKLVTELETAATATQELPTEDNEQVNQFISDMAKVSGLAAGVAHEASLLVKDVYRLSAMAQQPSFGGPSSGEDLLASIFGGAVPSFEDPDKKNRN